MKTQEFHMQPEGCLVGSRRKESLLTDSRGSLDLWQHLHLDFQLLNYETINLMLQLPVHATLLWQAISSFLSLSSSRHLLSLYFLYLALLTPFTSFLCSGLHCLVSKSDPRKSQRGDTHVSHGDSELLVSGLDQANVFTLFP